MGGSDRDMLVRELVAAGRTTTEIAAELGIGRGRVTALKRRLGLEVRAYRPHRKAPPRRRQFTKREIRAIRASEENGQVLADRFGVSKSAISQIRRRVTYKHVG